LRPECPSHALGSLGVDVVARNVLDFGDTLQDANMLATELARADHTNSKSHEFLPVGAYRETLGVGVFENGFAAIR
jgi:hypothetical protein